MDISKQSGDSSMNFLNNLDPNLLPYIGACLGLLCILIFVVGFLMQLVGGFLNIFGQGFGFILHILQGGPLSWCGCLLAFLGCIACAGIAMTILNASSSCATNYTNFCKWLGF